VGVSEEGEGRDLDGDGDTTDVVLHILDLGGVTFVNTGLAFPRSSPFDHDPPVRFACNDALGVFMVSEAETGRDVDEDGVEGEVSTWTFNRRTGVLKGLPFTHEVLVLDGDLAVIIADDGSGPALHVFDARDDSLATPAVGPSGVWGVRDGIVAFTRSEEGALDLNADGDASDPFVLQLYDADARRVVNAAFDVWPTGRACASCRDSRASASPRPSMEDSISTETATPRTSCSSRWTRGAAAHASRASAAPSSPMPSLLPTLPAGSTSCSC
jgi:hypothetical protein